MPRLEGKTAIVTGASRGIGAEISRLFAAEGARVICAARTVNEGDHPLEGSLAKTIADIKESGGEATAVAANISLPEDCEMLVSEARRIYGPVDVLVNNAALTYYLPIKDFPINRWMRSWAVNFHAPFILSQLVLTDMIERKSGSIVNISSISGIVGQDFIHMGYNASKGAVRLMTKSAAVRWAEAGIRVNSVHPGLMPPMAGGSASSGTRDAMIANTPMKRTGRREEVAYAVLFLASDEASFITGAELVVDGGFTAQ
jgi:NAD(P)-dependent dehydrogenase (short-subunit alcohol dehydrogenase family)